VPIAKDFEFEGVSTLSSDVYLLSPPNFPKDTINSVKIFFQKEIKEIRQLKFGNHDEKMTSICNSIIENSNELKVEQIVKTSISYNFQLNRSPIINKFIIPAKGEDLILDFKTIV